jgi:hypothetical protein
MIYNFPFNVTCNVPIQSAVESHMCSYGDSRENMIYAAESKLNCASRMHYMFESLFFSLSPTPFVTHLCTIDPWRINSVLELE